MIYLNLFVDLIQVGLTDDLQAATMLNTSMVRSRPVVGDTDEFGAPESRLRKFFPFYRVKATAGIDTCDRALENVDALFNRMESSTNPVTLEDMLLEVGHPHIASTARALPPHDGTEVFQPKRKKTRVEEGELKVDDPVWWDDHRKAYSEKLNTEWVHPKNNNEVTKITNQNVWFASLPWREKDLVVFMLLVEPHAGDNMSSINALAIFDEYTVDVSQEIYRCRWKQGAVGCLTKGSVTWLRFRKRYATGVEKLRIHGFWGKSVMWSSWPKHQLGELSGLSFNAFVTGCLFLSLATYCPP